MSLGLIGSALTFVRLALSMAALLAVRPALGQVLSPAAPPPSGPAVRAGIGEIRSWGYQLQRVDPDRIAASPFDLVVIDYSRNGTDARRFTPAEVAALKRKPDGARRILLAYMSIGEAEDYRYYWRQSWVEAVSVFDEPLGQGRQHGQPTAATPERGPPRVKPLRLPKLGAPGWLGRENEGWSGNFYVRYWDPAWQRLILAGPDSYLARILAAGFDGVFLDRIDTFQAVGDGRPEARDEMVRFVGAIAETARRAEPGFLIVPQNGEQLLADPAYLAVIDAVAKEDLLLGEEAEGARNSIATVSRSMRWLAPATSHGIPVLVVEYAQDKGLADKLRADITSRGFVPYFGVRALDRLLFPEDLAAPVPVAPLPPPRPQAPVASSKRVEQPPARKGTLR